jgi:hypothetical protein
VAILGPKSYDVALEDGREILGTFLDASRWQIMDEHLDGHDARHLARWRRCEESHGPGA